MSPAALLSGEADLTDPWVALEPGADPAERVRTLRRAHETFTEVGTVPTPVRSVVADSWRRSARSVSVRTGRRPWSWRTATSGRIARSIRWRG